MEKKSDQFFGELGKGSSGCVELWFSEENNSFHAKKIIRFDARIVKRLRTQMPETMTEVELETKRKLDMLEREVKFLKQTKHQNILNFRTREEKEKDGKLEVCLYTEYCDQGSLWRFVENPHLRLNEAQIWFVIKQLSQALAHIHSKNVLHRDIKPENILLRTAINPTKGKNAKVVLADFGFCKDTTKEKAITRLGTHNFVAPEIIFSPNQYPYDDRCDMWSLGATIYLLMFREHLINKKCSNFDEYTNEFKNFVLKDRVKHFRTKQLETNPNGSFYSDALCELLEKLLDMNPTNRISSQELLEKVAGYPDVPMPLECSVFLGDITFHGFQSAKLPEMYAYNKNALVVTHQVAERLMMIADEVNPIYKQFISSIGVVLLHKCMIDCWLTDESLLKKMNIHNLPEFNDFIKSKNCGKFIAHNTKLLKSLHHKKTHSCKKLVYLRHKSARCWENSVTEMCKSKIWSKS